MSVLASLSHINDVVAIVRDLASLSTDATGLDTPEGIQAKIKGFLAVAKRAAALTPSTADEHAVDVVAEYLDRPEAARAINDMAAYVQSLDA